MGRCFQNVDEVLFLFDRLIRRLNNEPSVRDDLLDSNLVLKYRYQDFDTDVIVDCRADRIQMESDPQAVERFSPDVEFHLDTDTLNEFWNGALNLPVALALRKIVAKGSIPKALKLLPILKPAFGFYREILVEIGRTDLVVQPPSKKAARAKKPGIFSRVLGARHTRRSFEFRDISLGPSLPVQTEPTDPGKIEFLPDTLPENPAELKRQMLRRMLLIRGFEQHLADAFAQGELPTEMIHLSIGQEATAVGACFALRPNDWINTTHRGHGHILAKGADTGRVMAELYGKADGVCKGRGGSMHVIDLPCGVMGSNGIVGAGPLLANGAAWSAKQLRTGQVSVVFFGDGATNQGMFHEACNFAAVFQLPVVLICENNLYGEFTPFADHCAVKSVSARAAAYDMPCTQIDGNDVLAVHRAVCEAVTRARSGQGPTLIESLTYRWHGHMEGEPTGYRTVDEIKQWKEKCPIRRFEQALLEQGLLDESTVRNMRDEVAAEVEQAVRFARTSRETMASEVALDVYAPEPPQVLQGAFCLALEGDEKTLSAAVNEAIAEEMERDPTVVMLGEDVRLGGYFGVSVGLTGRFGPDRVLDTPISENAIVGAAVGAAATGLRPICEILFSDFLTCCADPLVNQAAKLRYMSGGQNRVPMVLRTPVGGYIGAAAQHSHCFEGLFAGVPGLIVCAPSEPYTAKGILKSAIRSDNPVLFFEHKLLYAQSGPVPPGDFLLPLGKTRVRRSGTDATVVGILFGAHLAMLAAERLQSEGVSCEVLDPVTLYPLDLATILESVRKTGRLVVVEEAHSSFGFGARIVSAVAEAAFETLVAPPVRVGAMDVPMPYSKPLELAVLPDPDRVVEAIRKVL